MLNSIEVDGELYEDPLRVKQEVLNHFRKRFSEDWISRPKLEGIFISIGQDMNSARLVAPFLEEEIWRAVKESDANKAPGPDIQSSENLLLK